MIREHLMRRSVKPRDVDVYCDGETHTVRLEPDIYKKIIDGITVVKYGSLNFPDEQIVNIRGNDEEFESLVTVFAEDLSRIIRATLPRMPSKVIVRGVVSGDLEKTLEYGTDRWKENKTSSYTFPTENGNPSYITFALPVTQPNNRDSLMNALNLEPVHTIVDRFRIINPYNYFDRMPRPDSVPQPKEHYNELIESDLEVEKGKPMILVFDGRNAVPTNPRREGYSPYKFEGDPHLLGVYHFDVNYPRSIGRVDRDLLLTGLQTLDRTSDRLLSPRYLNDYIQANPEPTLK